MEIRESYWRLVRLAPATDSSLGSHTASTQLVKYIDVDSSCDSCPINIRGVRRSSDWYAIKYTSKLLGSLLQAIHKFRPNYHSPRQPLKHLQSELKQQGQLLTLTWVLSTLFSVNLSDFWGSVSRRKTFRMSKLKTEHRCFLTKFSEMISSSHWRCKNRRSSRHLKMHESWQLVSAAIKYGLECKLKFNP